MITRNKKSNCLYSFILLFALPAISMGQEISTPALTLENVLEIVRTNNPVILAEAKRLEASRNARGGAWLPEKPVITLEHMYTPPGNNIISDPGEKNILITEEFPFFTTLYYRGKTSSLAAEAAEQSYLSVVRDMEAETKTAFAGLQNTVKTLEAFKENVEIMKRLSKIAEVKYSVGHGPQSDVLKAQVELSKMLSMLELLEQENEIAAEMLNKLMSRPPQTSLVISTEQPARMPLPELEKISASGLQANPEIEKARLEMEQAGKAVSLAKSYFLPDLMLGYRKRNSTLPGMDGTQDLMLGFSIPLWFSKQTSMLKEARSMKTAAEMDFKTISDRKAYETAEYMARVKALTRLLELYETGILPQAEEALKTSESAYQADKTDFMDSLDAQRTLLGFRIEYYQYQFEYVKWLAELEKVAGAAGLRL